MGSYRLIADLYQAIVFFVQSGIFFDEVIHGLISSIFALLFYAKFKRKDLSFMIVLVTYLMDIDHLVDYFLYYGPQFSFTQFIRLEYFGLSGRAFVPFHAWEWSALALALSHYSKKHKAFLQALSVGIFAHLIWDSYTVGSISFYSIIVRITKAFSGLI